jgi:hypothetical protein
MAAIDWLGSARGMHEEAPTSNVGEEPSKGTCSLSKRVNLLRKSKVLAFSADTPLSNVEVAFLTFFRC